MKMLWKRGDFVIHINSKVHVIILLTVDVYEDYDTFCGVIVESYETKPIVGDNSIWTVSMYQKVEGKLQFKPNTNAEIS